MISSLWVQAPHWALCCQHGACLRASGPLSLCLSPTCVCVCVCVCACACTSSLSLSLKNKRLKNNKVFLPNLHFHLFCHFYCQSSSIGWFPLKLIWLELTKMLPNYKPIGQYLVWYFINYFFPSFFLKFPLWMVSGSLVSFLDSIPFIFYIFDEFPRVVVRYTSFESRSLGWRPAPPFAMCRILGKLSEVHH